MITLTPTHLFLAAAFVAVYFLGRYMQRREMELIKRIQELEKALEARPTKMIVPHDTRSDYEELTAYVVGQEYELRRMKEVLDNVFEHGITSTVERKERLSKVRNGKQ